MNLIDKGEVVVFVCDLGRICCIGDPIRISIVGDVWIIIGVLFV